MGRNNSCSSLSGDDGLAAPQPEGAAPALKKGPWTAAEDAILVEYVRNHGEGNWNAVQKNCGLNRCGKSCRLRWANHLRPNLKKGSFSPEEELLILQLHAQLGNKWARMAAQLPGRTDNEIKNFWNTRVKRRQRAGLPLYPTELQIQQQQRRRMASLRPPPLMVPAEPAPGSPIRPHSPMPFLRKSPLHSPRMMMMPDPAAEVPGAKRMREDGGLSFQFPMSPAPQPNMDPNPMGAATPPGGASMFHFDYGNGYGGDLLSSMYLAPVKTELPSSQLFADSGGGGGGGEGGGCGLLDALLQETAVPGTGEWVQRKLTVSDPIGSKDFIGGNLNGGGGGGNVDGLSASFPTIDEHLQRSNGTVVKRERPEEPAADAHDDISKLFDMISAPAIPATPEWYSPAADSCDISNGGQSSVVTDDELGIELQHLASSLAVPPANQDRNIGSCPWSNMPGIC